MPVMNVKVSGLAETHQMLTSLESKLKSGQLVRKVAAIVQDQAFVNASGRPGPKVQTGRLRASITTKVTGLYTAVVGPSAYYAPYVEFGHPVRKGVQTSTGRRRRNYIPHTWVPAYPFMIPAIAQTKDKIRQFIIDFLRIKR